MQIALFAALAAALAVAVVFVLGAAVRRRGRVARGLDDGAHVTRLAVQLEERERQVREARGERDTARQERDDACRDLAETRADLAAVRADHLARTEELAAAREQLDNQFKGLAAGVLKESTDTLLRQAKEQFDNQRQVTAAELEQRKEAIDNMVGPIRESLAKLGEHATEIEKQRVGAYEGLKSQVASLQRVAGSLSEALRSPNIRGQWAEQELGNILELSGLRQHIDYQPQPTVAASGGRLRPDAIVSIPGGLKVVIDAKAPLENFLRAHEATDGTQERDLLAGHASAISRHAKALGDRDYADVVAGSPDFVLMFVPADPILDAAMKVQPTLWEHAWHEHRVLIATPGLLLAFLRTVALAWQQQDMQNNAQEIADLGKELYDRLRVFTEHMNGMGKGLRQAVAAYNSGVGSLEGRLLPQARRFEDLGAVADSKRIPELAAVDDSVRAVNQQRSEEAQDAASTVVPHKLSA